MVDGTKVRGAAGAITTPADLLAIFDFQTATAVLMSSLRAVAKQSILPSFRGDATHRTRNLEIPGLVLTHHPGMTTV